MDILAKPINIFQQKKTKKNSSCISISCSGRQQLEGREDSELENSEFFLGAGSHGAADWQTGSLSSTWQKLQLGGLSTRLSHDCFGFLVNKSAAHRTLAC